MKNRFTKLSAVSVSLALLLCGCGGNGGYDTADREPSFTAPITSKAENSAAETVEASENTDASETVETAENTSVSETVELAGGRGTMLSLDNGGALEINRLSRSAVSSENDGVWTVFVYMCGSDLETDQGSATDDLLEMQAATESCGRLRFVVEADGSKEWWNDMCEDGKKQRLLISDGGCEVVYSGASTDMGDPDTLSDFLSWGLGEYDSQYTVLDFWNHGGGSISGVCFDELHNDDSLSLKEIDIALASVFKEAYKPFEIIGSDACLMATVEFANILASYGNYMVASQDLESGYGWDYGSFAEALENGADDGASVGEYICDGYYFSCMASGEEDEATLSVVDLSRLDAFLTEFNSFCADIYENICDDGGLTEVIKAAKSALNFGGNNRSEGYTNMVDLKDFIYYTEGLSDRSRSVDELFDECIVYAVNGYNSFFAGGLSIYYPLSVQGSSELADFKDICVSPYYISIADICAYGSESRGSIDGYAADTWLGGNTGFWSDSDIDVSEFGYWEYNDADGLNSDAGNTALEYAVAPNIDSEGIYNFTLTQDSLYNLDTVYCNIMLSYWDDEDNCEYMLDLGTDDYVDMDWETGECRDLFDGLWFALPDGQPICSFLVESVYNDDETYNIYTAPIYLNGEYTNLRIKQSYGYDVVTSVLGVWDGIDENGSAARDVYQLKAGDVIEPCYYAYDAETLEYAFDFYGWEYVCDGELRIDYDCLYDGDYYYAFEIYDYYGNSLYTDFVLFGAESDEYGGIDLFYYE
ncbi:MAG: clostripain-related cysteine peptidase [Bacteroides sp.]|nr:clostripain-related cysteine peptidase [Bacteroides sp.]